MKPLIYMLCGLPGSGKTTYSLELQKKTGFKRFSLDEEYYKVVGNEQKEFRDFEIEKQVGENIRSIIAPLIEKGESLILDFCPWQKDKREEYKKFIESHGGIRKLLYFYVPLDELKLRAKKRNELGNNNLQYITPSMLDDFVARFEPPAGEGEEVIRQ
jgi:predicted kinase